MAGPTHTETPRWTNGTAKLAQDVVRAAHAMRDATVAYVAWAERETDREGGDILAVQESEATRQLDEALLAFDKAIKCHP